MFPNHQRTNPASEQPNFYFLFCNALYILLTYYKHAFSLLSMWTFSDDKMFLFVFSIVAELFLQHWLLPK